MEKKREERPRRGNLYLLLMGMYVIVVGLITIDDPVYEFKGGYKIDLGAFKWPFVVSSLLVGGYFVWAGITCRRSQNASYWICSECEKVSKKKYMINSGCADCGGTMEPLEGFYDRHPELKK